MPKTATGRPLHPSSSQNRRSMGLYILFRPGLPAGGAQASALATLLDRWIRDNPRPYVGQHWPW